MIYLMHLFHYYFYQVLFLFYMVLPSKYSQQIMEQVQLHHIYLIDI